jgi:hypothetical protein
MLKVILVFISRINCSTINIRYVSIVLVNGKNYNLSCK